LLEKHGRWCQAEGELIGHAKHALLARVRWGIHGCSSEAFGIAVAEMVCSGMIPFVPMTCGPAEIVDEPVLCFRDEDEAVARIDTMLRDSTLQQHVRARLAERAKCFGADCFMSGLRKWVLEFACAQGIAP
jgi:glycosyltransferase involved in cell wall biosynthesis